MLYPEKPRFEACALIFSALSGPQPHFEKSSPGGFGELFGRIGMPQEFLPQRARVQSRNAGFGPALPRTAADRPIKNLKFRCAKCGGRLTDWVMMRSRTAPPLAIDPQGSRTKRGNLLGIGCGHLDPIKLR